MIALSANGRPDAPPCLPRWAEAALLVLILAGAAALRLALIGQAPPGPHHDEAANLLDALDVLGGKLVVFSPRSYGREMLAMYLAAPLVALLGPTALAIRLPAAIAGILTVLAVYLLGKELFRAEGQRAAQLAGLLAALFLALSYWLLTLNRLGLRANYLPLVETLCFLFLWRALRTGRLREYAAAGLFLGLSFHTYISARFLPVALAAFLGLALLRRDGRALLLGGPSGRWRPWLVLGAAAGLVAAPLLVYFALHPESFLLRAGSVSIFNPKLHGGDPLGLWVRSVAGNLAAFGLAGDRNWLYNWPGRPGLDAFQAVLFWAGLAWCVVRWRRPRCLFLAVWWLAMLMPAILAPDPIPHYLRAIGALPPAALIAARALAGVLARVTLPRPGPAPARGRLRAALPAVLLAAAPVYAAVAGYDVARTYFHDWLPRDEVYYAYYGHLADLAALAERDPDPEAVYLFPVNYDRRADPYRSYTVDVLHPGPPPVEYVLVDDATVAADLVRATQGRRHVRLVVWTHGEHVDADPRGVLPFYLERFGRPVGEEARRGYQIAAYELPAAPVDFAAPLPWTPAGADYGGLRLAAAAHRAVTPSGEAAWVALRWQVTQPPAGDLRVSLRLADASGRLLAQADASLMDNAHRFASGWPAGEEVTTYHLLPTPPGTPPGEARLSLVVYEPDTLRPVAWSGGPLPGGAAGGELDLGAAEIGPAVRLLAVEPEVALRERLARGLELVGYVVNRPSLRPGDTLPLALHWRARRDVGRDYSVQVRLLDAAGGTAARWTAAPGVPTGRRRAGDDWSDWYELPVPADLPPGAYRLVVSVVGSDVPGPPEAALGSVQITGD